MKILIKAAKIIDSHSQHHQKICDILIEDGCIKKIASTIKEESNYHILSFPNLHISQGWFDPSVSFGEPGFEERETIENGLKTAAASGFTAVQVNANTHPLPDTKGILNYIKTQALGNVVNLYPAGALTVGSKGVDLAEMYDMHQAGAVSFYDYKAPIANANLLKIALQYSQNFGGVVQSFPMDRSVASKGVVHEHIQSTKLGLRGIPAFSEELQIARDLAILEYTGGKLHIPTISTGKSVALIREAKTKGLEVSCSVSIYNLVLTDQVLDTFHTHYKLLPPLRTQEENEALIAGLKDGTIDGVTSDHNPLNEELKKMEFDHASFGSTGLQSCFGALQNVLSLEESIEALTHLKSIFGVPSTPIGEGLEATITLFDPNLEWELKSENLLSPSKNESLLGQKLKGKALGIINNNQYYTQI